MLAFSAAEVAVAFVAGSPGDPGAGRIAIVPSARTNHGYRGVRSAASSSSRRHPSDRWRMSSPWHRASAGTSGSTSNRSPPPNGSAARAASSSRRRKSRSPGPSSVLANAPPGRIRPSAASVASRAAGRGRRRADAGPPGSSGAGRPDSATERRPSGSKTKHAPAAFATISSASRRKTRGGIGKQMEPSDQRSSVAHSADSSSVDGRSPSGGGGGMPSVANETPSPSGSRQADRAWTTRRMSRRSAYRQSEPGIRTRSRTSSAAAASASGLAKNGAGSHGGAPRSRNSRNVSPATSSAPTCSAIRSATCPSGAFVTESETRTPSRSSRRWSGPSAQTATLETTPSSQ